RAHQSQTRTPARAGWIAELQCTHPASPNGIQPMTGAKRPRHEAEPVSPITPWRFLGRGAPRPRPEMTCAMR
ncbi:MAG: hypothetical protein J2P56_09985, partial [Verrucomicrobia bacterium]|nr:hypothetical protein [Verrucomicrobiota bacterium]